MLDYDRKGPFVGEYMTKVDGGAMQYALEARSPFLDQDLWIRCSPALRHSAAGRSSESRVRELARRRLGERVATGRKRGFGIPVQRWMMGRWYTQCDRDVPGFAVTAGRLDTGRDAVMADLRAAKERQYVPIRLWYLYVLNLAALREASG